MMKRAAAVLMTLCTTAGLAVAEEKKLEQSLAGGAGPCTTSWAPAQRMAQPRAFYSATVLDDGRVLVAGGYIRYRVFPQSEIYDPAAGTWAPTGDMVTARAGHGAVQLADGRVLVAGGAEYDLKGEASNLTSAEVYDPATGQWTETGSLNVARFEPNLTLLPDGRVLIASSTERPEPRPPNPRAASAEIWDPASGKWSFTADMSTPRHDHIQALLPDGRVLVAGGFERTISLDRIAHASAEIYDLSTDTWTATGTMTQPRSDHEFVVLQDGRVMVTGGIFLYASPPPRSNTGEIYDPATGQWARIPGTMSDPKNDHAIALRQDGTVLVAGGVRTLDTAVASADLYDPVTNRWTALAPMSRGRYGILGVTLQDGRVLVVGGLNHDSGGPPTAALSSVEIYGCDGK